MTPIDSTSRSSRTAAVDEASTGEKRSASSNVGGDSLLPDPTVNIGDIGEAIARLMIDSAFAQRKTAREAKAKAESAMEVAQKHELEHMHAAADEKYAAAQIDAWVQIGTGVVTLGAMAAEASGKTGWVHDAGKTAGQAMKDGGTDIAKGAGKLASSGQGLAADTSTAAAKEAENAAKRMKTSVDDCAEDVRGTKESARKALDFLKEYQVAQAQTQLAALRRA